ncbi:threonine dehydratase [Clostridiales bacterium PH28_bin88]|nr:threonine dehydratase [Clostridiales bacterium PH28_bin88]
MSDTHEQAVSLEDIVEARQSMQGVVHQTPLDLSATFSALTGNRVYLKTENWQKTGSFKIRGAFNKLRCLSAEERSRGVIAASAGNHAQGVAYAAAQAGIKASVVMPVGAPVSKVMATKGYGARVILAGEGYDAAYRRAVELQQETGATFVHAFDDQAVIAGQGTIGLEILEVLPELEAVVVPVGGGGLISGVATAIKTLKPDVKILGVQADGAASMAVSVREGAIRELPQAGTIADGIAVKRPGSLTFSIIQGLVDDIVTVPDEDITTAILMLLERSKMIAEGAGAVALAALLTGRLGLSGKRVAAIVSGGNIDVHVISQIIERGLVKAGRFVSMRTVLLDRPGALGRLLSLVASAQANVISITHDRTKPNVPIRQAEVVLSLETRDSEHINQIMELLVREGYCVERL